MVISAKELHAIEKMAVAGTGNEKITVTAFSIATTLGLTQSTTKRWLHGLRSEVEMVSHHVGRPRGAEAGMCPCFSCCLSHIARVVRDFCFSWG